MRRKKRECVKIGREGEKREISSVKIESGCAKRKMRVCEERKVVWEERKKFCEERKIKCEERG